ncbi:MAG: S8 family serine peptidase [Anaerolineae bacterium]|nr:S8 family serine peptidase [Anaerolineae bacterium]
MRKIAPWFLAVVLVTLLLLPAGAEGLPPTKALPSPMARGSLPRPTSPLPAAPLEPALLRALAGAAPGEMLPVIFFLRQQPAPAAGEVRAHLVAGLQSLAEQSQAPLRACLEQQQAAGAVESYTPFWIVNAIAVRARPAAVRLLAAHPDVALVRLDHYRQWIADPPQPGAAARPLAVPEWNVARIGAPEVWAALHISGTNAVVAGMDTGVDWLHPALQANYRGFSPHGPPNHIGNWYDAINGSLYPIDDHGHGTHTMGSAVGREGIGVAPGARWIGVKVFNGAGYAYDSWIHAGFQWLLAPGGDPERAPDVVNCSWSSPNSALTTFQPDLQALRAIGVLPVFASGNYGAGEGSVGSPASLPESVAVGASDEYDEVASFSSRGPSPWGQVRPHIVAPGVHVVSSLPGGVYGSANGTSMAAPHVTGLAALLRSVSPTLGVSRTLSIITRTAVPLTDVVPNNDSGWGRIDALAAVAALAQPGYVSGTVRQVGGSPIGGATVAASPHGGGGGGTTHTDDAGGYRLALAPDVYDLAVSAFGYQPETCWGVQVISGATTVENVFLTPLPSGVLHGAVTAADSGAPLSATVTLLGTPLETTGATYTFTPPAGVYTVQARRLGYRVVTATAVVTAGETTVIDLALPPAPTLLLVDSGGWYYESQAAYYRAALDDLAYAYDEWPIRRLPGDLPGAADLLRYDAVVWSAPWDAPGFIGAADAVTGYLDGGGRLLLSGQDVGLLDGGWSFSPYYRAYLKCSWEADNSNVWTLEGLPGEIMAGIAITITGPGGADNQHFPDVVAVADPDAAAPVLAYRGNGLGGVRVGTCLDYRVVYLSFGFEGIDDRGARRAVMGRALDWLVSAPLTAGLEMTPPAQTRVGAAGTVVTHALRLRHVGQGGPVDAIHLAVAGDAWPTQLSTAVLTLEPCTSGTVVVSVTLPITAGWNDLDVITLTAQSSLSPTLSQTAVLTSKVPAPILLVDDDRWYEQKKVYQVAAKEAGLPYDLWQTHPALGSSRDHSPPLDVLRWYPVVVWWTGYDWYQPITADEEATLQAYLESGGRLFLSAQDFLYEHGLDPFGQEFLGVLTYTEGVTPTLVRRTPQETVVGIDGDLLLDYPYPNWSDGVEPTPGTAVLLRDERRHGLGLARRAGQQAAVFFPFPFEALPREARPQLVSQVTGWLSWMGGSTFAADRAVVAAGSGLTYSLRLSNDGPEAITASLSNTIPLSLALVPGSLGPPLNYDPATRRVSWSGGLAAGESLAATYCVTVAEGLDPATPIVNVAALGIEEQRIHFQRAAAVRVGAPDLAPSRLGCSPSPARPGGTVTCTLQAVNAGLSAALSATAVISLPGESILLTDTLSWLGGGTAEPLPGAVCWSGPLAVGKRVTVTYQLTLPRAPLHPPLYSVAFLDDGAGGAWERAAWINLEPWRVFLPLVRASSAAGR